MTQAGKASVSRTAALAVREPVLQRARRVGRLATMLVRAAGTGIGPRTAAVREPLLR